MKSRSSKIKPMKGMLINPFDRTIKKVTLAEGDTLEQIYTLLKCTLIDSVSVIPLHSLYVDDEGLFVKDQRYFDITYDKNSHTLAGRALLVGYNNKGESISCDEGSDLLLYECVEWKAPNFFLKPRMDFIEL